MSMPRAVAWSWCPRFCEIRIVAPAARNSVYAACNHGLDAAACNNVSRGNWKICKAPSNRAKCMKCEAKIEAGELRIELLHYWSLPGARVGTNGRYHLTNYGPTVKNSNGAAAASDESVLTADSRLYCRDARDHTFEGAAAGLHGCCYVVRRRSLSPACISRSHKHRH